MRYQLQQQGLQVNDAPDDDVARETYNFPPGAFGLVYRADVPDTGFRDRGEVIQHSENAASSETSQHEDEVSNEANSESGLPKATLNYELKAMKWGLIPFWTKRSPDYSSMLRTINCRDDSLSQPSGLWTTMKARKRCIVVAQGFYEWLKKGPAGSKQEKIPHFIKRKDDQLMLMAGLWDCVHYEDTPEDQKLYTYTIITTESNKQLSFLHDRMPVILDPGSDAMKQWLDPTQNKWTNDLQNILQPFAGELECYPVNKDVGKVGNNDPSFIIPVDSKENKKNIANFFDNARKNESPKKKVAAAQGRTEATSPKKTQVKEEEDNDTRETKDNETTENHAPMPVPSPSSGGTKRKADILDEGDPNILSQDDHDDQERNPKQSKLELSLDTQSRLKSASPTANDDSASKKETSTATKSSASNKSTTSTRKTRSAVSNEGLSKKPNPVKADGSQRITSFFGSQRTASIPGSKTGG